MINQILLTMRVYTSALVLIILSTGNASADISDTLTEWQTSSATPVTGRPIDFSWSFKETKPFYRPEDNLLTNGAFEVLDSSGLPEVWSFDLNMLAHISSSDQVYRSELRSLMFASTSNVTFENEQNITLLPDTTYTLSAWIRTNLTQGSIQVYPNGFEGITYKAGDSKGTITKDLVQGWDLHQVAFTTSQSVMGTIKISLNNLIGNVWIDDVYLVHGEASDYSLPDNPAPAFPWNKLQNGGFENGTGNWEIDSKATVVTNSPWRGKASVYVNSTVPGYEYSAQRITITEGKLPVLQANTDYYLMAWVKTNLLSGKAEIYPWDFDGLSYYPGFKSIAVTGKKDWSLYITKFRTGSGIEGRINFRINQGIGEAWFDDIFLIKATKPHFSGGSSDVCNVQLVNASAEALINGPYFWESGPQTCLADMLEYGGPVLSPGQAYNWRVIKYDSLGRIMETGNAHQFIAGVMQSTGSNRNHIRTFRNFNKAEQILAGQQDLSFTSNLTEITAIKSVDYDHISLPYTLISTMIVPANAGFNTAEKLESWARNKGLSNNGVPEAMFAHFREDTQPITLPIKNKTLASHEEYTRSVLGWDPINDRNSDGIIDETEFATRINLNASARSMQEARVPIYFWGDPNDPVKYPSDFVMNTNSADYQQFMAESYLPDRLIEMGYQSGYANGLYFDSASNNPPTPIGTVQTPRLEFSTKQEYLEGRLELFKLIKQNLGPDVTLLGNGWDNKPMVIEGSQIEGWLNISVPLATFDDNLKKAVQHSKRGVLDSLQVNPIYHNLYAPLSNKISLSRERDQIYALASYYLAAGDRSYFRYAGHPYEYFDNLQFDAIDFDIGTPLKDYFIAHEENGQGDNLLSNGGFELPGNGVIPQNWNTSVAASQFVSLDADVKYAGGFSTKIDVPQGSPININIILSQNVGLEPDTQYTLSAYMKIDNISIFNTRSKADIYPHEYGNLKDVYDQYAELKKPQDWTYRYYTFTTQDILNGRINFRLREATGKVWFDNLALHKGRPRVIYAREYSNALVLVRPGAINNSTPNSSPLNTPILLKNGDFEITEAGTDNPAEWIASEPVEIDTITSTGAAYTETSSAKISVPAGTLVNNINKQDVELKPFTTYTLSGYIKTQDVTGKGADIYPFDYDDSTTESPWKSVKETQDWTFVEHTFTTGVDTSGRINYRIHDGSGTAWFDNIVLTEDYNDPMEYDELDGVYYPVAADGSKGAGVTKVILREGEAVILSKSP